MSAVVSADDGVAYDYCWPVETANYQINALYYYKDGSAHSCHFSSFNGIDVGNNGETDVHVVAITDGVIEHVYQLESSFGNYIILKHDDGTESYYCHLASFAAGIAEGVRVSKGQMIGIMGTSGNSSGIHLHFEWSGGDPYDLVYKERFMGQIILEQNVRSNNASKSDSACKKLVSWIDKYYVLSSGYYHCANRVTIQGSDLQLYYGQTDGYAAVITGFYDYTHIRWSSSDESVVKVDENGAVKAEEKEGTAVITAYLVDDDGNVTGVSDSRTITVKAPSVELNYSSYTLGPNETVTLEADVQGPSEEVTWTCSDPLFQHETTGSTLTITGPLLLSDSTKTIYAEANGVTAACEVKLTRTATSINLTSKTLYVGQTSTLKIKVNGQAATATWKSTNSKVASVSSSGKVTAKKAGTVTVKGTVTVGGSSKTFSCKVTVKKSSITLNYKSKAVYIGNKLTLKATVKGKSQNVTWKTSNKKVAKVSSKGVVTPVKAGVVTITATANGKKATCKITVKNKSYKTLYKEFLQKGTFKYNNSGYVRTVSAKSYCVLDINQDGTPELIVKSVDASLAFPVVTQYVFTVYNNKVVYCGNVDTRGYANVQYSKKYKALLTSGWFNGTGGQYVRLHTLKNRKVSEYKYAMSCYASTTSQVIVYYVATSGGSNVKVSKSEYDKTISTYFKKSDIKSYKFKNNTAANLKKSFG